MKPSSKFSPLAAVLLVFLFCAAAARTAASLTDDDEQAELDEIIGKTLWPEKQGGGAVDLDDAHLKGLIEYIEDNCGQKYKSLKRTHTITDAFLWTADGQSPLAGRSRVTVWFEENSNGKGKGGEQNDYFVDVVLTDKGEEFDFADLNPDTMCNNDIHPYSPVERENDGDCINPKGQNLKGDGQDRRQLGRCGNKLNDKRCLVDDAADAADVEDIDSIIASGYWLCGCDALPLCEKETQQYKYHLYEVALCCGQQDTLFDFDLPLSPENKAYGKVGYHKYQDDSPGSTFCANYKGDVPESKAGLVDRGGETFKQMLFHSSFIREDSSGGTQICPGFTTHLWEKKVSTTPEGCWKLECGKPVSEVYEDRGKTFIDVEDTGITCPKTGKPGRNKECSEVTPNECS